MFEEDKRMPLLDMLLTFSRVSYRASCLLYLLPCLLCPYHLLNVNNIYAEMKRVKKASLAQVEEMEVKLSISKVELAERNEAMAAKQKELEDL
ncbi:hypothetical protein Patl1_36908 [Pistacia atlantica]|nr:hypothetical protein Patl1_36908 [Pistacia atlantica]